ncbi:KICSTOR complex protein SZT2 isoform X2 [Exaiptasia diaphana]|uniref:KICSTOR complex protein SZT2 n=1 Tax=Exaiptasia diaphana TaxID=2652724 RepID=A0A913XZQ0_EXADI|nr:KICSTOR complex protein SZT2 isoform X2 [Exaiptasia diaphana]
MDGNEDTLPSYEGKASQVFLLMGQEYRISRSIRAQWFFQQVNSVLPQPKPKDELIASNKELEILSVLSNNNTAPAQQLYLLPSTHITFIGRKYRFVFCLDISPSLAIVDIQSGSVITDEAFLKFKNCLLGLVAPFSVPGNDVILRPELYITVLAYTSILSPETPQILIQGVLVTEDNVDMVLETVGSKLTKLENTLADTIASTQKAKGKTQKTGSESENDQTDAVTLLSPEAGPIAMLRSAILALQLLPDNASAGAVVITDGVFALPDASAVDSLLAQLRGSTVCCTFLKVGSGFHAHCSIGYIPHCDLMQFIAMATSGAYLANTPPVVKDTVQDESKGLPAMNLYHKSLLCWSFQRDYDLSKIESWIGDAMDLNKDDLAWPLLNTRSTFSYALSEWERNAMQPSMHKKQMETKLHTSITSVLSVRLREGYSVQEVVITKGGKQLEVTLTLPWKQHVQIQYVAVAAWPLSKSNRMTHVEVTITAPYEFLHDVSYLSKESITSSYRAMVVKKFRQTMKNIQSTDELLTHLQSFSSNPSYYTIPDSARNGVPLFYLPPNSSNPVLSLQHERKISKSQESQFAVFWKPVLTLDTTVWQRWMHCHRIGLLLEHDIPLPKNMHLAVGSDFFHSIQCRMALSSLNSLLRSMSSFVLLENHSYIKFIEGENADSPPLSFCLIRVSSRPPCIVIRLAFLGGTPGHTRHAITKELRSNLIKVKAPIGPVSKLSKLQQDNKGKSKSKKKGSQRLAEDKPCVLLLKKPLERILVRYDRVPEDLYFPYPEALLYSVYSTNTGLQYANRTQENHMKVLCHYMFHQRWIWSVQEDGPRHINTEVVARVLNTLTKLRLQEKFNFASNNAGIVTMAKEVEMLDKTSKSGKTYSCIVQYVMFPPYSKPAGDAVKDWVDGGQAPSQDTGGNLQMVTEVWIEPQFGVIDCKEKSLQYLDGLQYYEVPQAIFEADYKYVSAFLTFERLWCMCDDQVISAPSWTDSPLPGRISPSPDRNWTVESVLYPFDPILILPKTRQVEMVFSSVKEATGQDSSIQGEMPNEALFKLLIDDMSHLHEREIKMSEKNCQDLVQHILQRERSGIPVPFIDALNSTKTSSVDSSNSAGEGSNLDNTPLIKWRCFVRSVQGLAGNCRLMLTFIPASLKYVKLFGKKVSHCRDNKTIFREKDSNTLEKVRDALTKRALTPIMEDTEKISLTSQESSQDSPPLSQFASLDKHRPASLIMPPVLTSPTELENQKFNSQGSTDKTPEETTSRCVQFKDHDNNPTPTKENLSPLTQSTPNMENDGWFSYTIPVYCYDCPLYNLTHVDEKYESGQRTEEYRKREDIFQDFTHTSQVFVDPFSLEEMPRLSEGRTLGRFGSSKDLLLHCNAVHDLFFRSFVTSIFTSFQSGHQMNVRDVQSAVDTCEENFLEIDITEFIRTLCGHFVRNTESPKSSDTVRGPSSLLLCHKTQSPIFQRQNFQEFGTLAFLKSYLNNNCESSTGLHQSVKERFMGILGRYFKMIPNYGDLFFYCPQITTNHGKPSSCSFEPEEDQEDIEDHDKGDEEEEVFGETVVLIHDDEEDYGPLSSDSDESDYGGSEGESDFGDAEDDDKSLSTPLFLQLTCSLRDRSTIGGGTMTPVPIDSLPVCIGEIVRRMEEAEESFDLFSPSLQITIDLNCLTLSPVPDYSTLKSSVNHPTFSTSFSGSCGESPISLSPQEKFEFKRLDSKTVTSHDIDGLSGPDPFRSLPHQQRLAMNTISENVQWLLQDEVVSELRHTGPYTTATLDKVERHVQKSEGHPMCIYRNISLQFVFGAEQSMELFMKEFEEMNSLDYKLNKVEDYYYLTSLNEHDENEEPNRNQAKDNLEETSQENVLGGNSPKESSPQTQDSPSAGNTFIAVQQSPGKNMETGSPLPGEDDQEISDILGDKGQTDASDVDNKSKIDVQTECGDPVRKVDSVCTEESEMSVDDEEKSPEKCVEVKSDNSGDGSQLKDLKETETYSNEEHSRSEKPHIGGEPSKKRDLQVGGEPSKNEENLKEEGQQRENTEESTQTSEVNIDEVPIASNESSVDISVPLSVITSGAPLCCCDDVSTPVGEFDFSSPVEAASTPIHLPDRDECFPTNNQQVTSLISASHNSEALEMISLIDAAKEDGCKDGEKQRSLSSSKKSSPKEHKLQFWLVLRLCNNCVDIFFHLRHSEDSHMSPTMAGGLIEIVVNAIHENCRAVNQRMLLQDLYDTKMCNSLLFPEADEDIWKHEDLRMSVSPVGVYISKSDGSGYLGRYVQGEYIYQPGHFQCSSKWFDHLIFHPRLQDPSGNTSNSLGHKIIRSVLDRFAVKNRRDMFVYKESSGKIFYFRLLESLCVLADQPQFLHENPSQDLAEELDTQSHNDAMSNLSQKGSQLSLSQISLPREPEPDDDLSEPTRSNIKRTYSQSLPYDKVKQSLAFNVYGVDDPGTEITVDLLEVLINRLDDATLDALTFTLSRNPNSKLNYSDVMFIQPIDGAPSDKLSLVIPPIEIGYLYPLFYYLKQNLLQIFTVPRYAEANPRQHFRDPHATPNDQSTEIFIYNRPHSSGAKCVACISMRFLDSQREQIQFEVARVPSINVEHLDRNFYEDMTEVQTLSDDMVLEDNYIIEFSIWKRGSIGQEQLSSQLKCITQHALCDLLMEYLLLPAPLSSIPEEYFVTQTFKLRSLSAPPTPSDVSPRSSKLGVKLETLKDEKSEASTGQSDGKTKISRKISNDSTKSAPCHHRTPSTDSQGMEFKSFHEKQSSKGHRRSKSADIRDKLFKSKKSPTTSKEPSLVKSEKDDTQETNQKLGFEVMPKSSPINITNDESVAKDTTIKHSAAMETVAKDATPTDVVGMDNNVSSENAELAIEGSCEKNVEENQQSNAEMHDEDSHHHVEAPRDSVCNDSQLKLEETYDTFSQQEIRESQEYATPPTNDSSHPLNTMNVDPTQYSSSLQYPPTNALLTVKKDETWQDLELRRRRIKDRMTKRIQYESGEKGELHPNFHEPGRELFLFAHRLGAPSIYFMEGKLLSRFAVDFMLSELTNLMANMCPEMVPRFYRQAPDDHHDNTCHHDDSESKEHRCSCPHYKPGREALKAQGENESSVDMTGRVFIRTPGSPCFFVLIARDYNQWKSCLGMESEHISDESTTRAFSSRQRFKALESPVVTARSQDSSSLCSTSTCTIPRQKLILLTFIDKKIILYTYNLATDVNQSLEDQIQRLIHWNNARCHLTSCLVTQKMGLFHHLQFAQINQGKKDDNPYSMPTSDIDVFALISKATPLDRERGFSRSLSASYLTVFDQVLREVTPSRSLQRTPYLHHRDPVKRQGYHFREIRAAQIKKNTIQAALNDLYVKWQQAPPHHPVGDDKVEILKRSSRLVHYCACPLLFHPDWREKLSDNSQQSTQQSNKGPHDTASETPTRPQKTLDSTISESRNSKEKSSSLLEAEDEWHKNLRSAFIQQYIQYMQSLQFVVVQTRPQSPKPVKGSKRLSRRTGANKMKGEQLESMKQLLSRTNSDQTRFHQYLQKTTPGGIMLMELLFQGLYFYVRLYAIDCSRIPSGYDTSQHESRMFLEDCSHYKDYIHLLSFTYDFHLRQAQSYLSGRQMIFNKGYRVTDLLGEVLRKHPEYPGFARNHICKGEIAVPCDPVISSINVFKYIVKHSSQYDFSTIKVNKINDGDTSFILLGTDQVLFPSKDSHYYSNLRDNAEYDITMVVTLKNAFEGSVIHLEYFILMTSRRELFPKLSLRVPTNPSLGSHGENGERRGSLEVKSPRVRFARSVPDTSPQQTKYSPERKSKTNLTTRDAQSFHRSASSPHSLNKMVQEITKSSITQSHSDENIPESKKRLGTSPHSYSSGAISTMDGRSTREVALLNESSQRAHDHLVLVICRAQTHSKRDMLWFRLLAEGTSDEEKEAKKRRKSEFRRPVPDLAANWSSGIEVEELYRDIGSEATTSRGLSLDELKLLLSTVVCKSLRNCDKNLVPLLSMNISWYHSLLRVLMAKFSMLYRMFSSTGEDAEAHYLVLLNPNELDMFVLVIVDTKDNKTDIQVVFRDEAKASGDVTEDLRHFDKPIRDHIYSVLNAACFHMWTALLPS